jgi:hypothetical protein
MGQNSEIARRWCDVMGMGNEATQAASAELVDPDIDFYPVRKFPEAEPCHGREGFAQFMETFADSYAQTQWTVKHVAEVGDDRVLVWAALETHGRGSGMQLEGDVWICFWLRHGRFFRIENHVTTAGALHALGLEPDAGNGLGLPEGAA